MKVLLNDQAEEFLKSLNIDSNFKSVAGVYKSAGYFTWFKFSDQGDFDTGEEEDFNNAFQKIKSNNTFIGEFQQKKYCK